MIAITATERIYGRIVERLQAEVDRLTDQVGTLELRVDELGRTLRTRTAELQAVRIECDHALAELARVRAQLADRTARWDEARRHIACSSRPRRIQSLAPVDNRPGMALRDIGIFLPLADELHFGRTAERLHITAARVSQSIRAQERLIGGPLFERNTRTVRLTPLGRQLQSDLRGAHQQIADAVRTADGLAGTLITRDRLTLRVALPRGLSWLPGRRRPVPERPRRCMSPPTP